MIIRRALYWWMWVATAALPVWPIVAWASLGGDSGGWALAGLVVAMPVLFLVMLVVSLMVTSRRSVRESRAVSWEDAAMLLPWHAAIIGFGFLGDTAGVFAVLGVALGVVAFWVALWQIIREASRRAKAVFAEYEQMATAPSVPQEPDWQGEMIVIAEGKRPDTP